MTDWPIHSFRRDGGASINSLDNIVGQGRTVLPKAKQSRNCSSDPVHLTSIAGRYDTSEDHTPRGSSDAKCRPLPDRPLEDPLEERLVNDEALASATL